MDTVNRTLADQLEPKVSGSVRIGTSIAGLARIIWATMKVVAIQSAYSLSWGEEVEVHRDSHPFLLAGKEYEVLAVWMRGDEISYLVNTEWGNGMMPYHASSQFFSVVDGTVPASWHFHMMQAQDAVREILLGPACLVYDEMFYKNLLNGEDEAYELWASYLEGLWNPADEVIACSGQYLKLFEEGRNDHPFLSDAKLVKVGADGVGPWFMINREITPEEVTLLNILEAEILWQFSNEARFGYRLVRL